MNRFKAALIGIGMTATAVPALAGSVSNTFQASIVIQDACAVNLVAPTNLDFGSQGVLSANVDQTSLITLTCSLGTAYNVALNAGANPGSAGDVNTRRMANTGSYVSYQMYRNLGRTSVWGDSIGTNTSAGTGLGLPQALTVYGRVPAQTTPAAGTYTDTVTVTVSY